MTGQEENLDAVDIEHTPDGLPVGDALGTVLEFRPPESFTPVTDIVGGGPFRLKPGKRTDDCSIALCLAQSLVEKGFNPADQVKTILRARPSPF